MGRAVQVAGVITLFAGIGLVIYGGPYYMLDWGAVFVISGALMCFSGLILLLLGAVLLRLGSLKADILSLRTLVAEQGNSRFNLTADDLALAAQGPHDAAASRQSIEAPALSAPAHERPVPDMRPGALAAAAGGAGLAVAAQSIFSAISPEARAAQPAEQEPDHEDKADAEADARAMGERPEPWFDAPALPEEDGALDRDGDEVLHHEVSPAVAEPVIVESGDSPGSAEDEPDGAALSITDRSALDDLIARLDLAPSMSDTPADGEKAPALDAPLRRDLFARIDEAARTLKGHPEAAAQEEPWDEPGASDEVAPLEEAAPALAEPEALQGQRPGSAFDDLRASFDGSGGARPVIVPDQVQERDGEAHDLQPAPPSRSDWPQDAPEPDAAEPVWVAMTSPSAAHDASAAMDADDAVAAGAEISSWSGEDDGWRGSHGGHEHAEDRHAVPAAPERDDSSDPHRGDVEDEQPPESGAISAPMASDEGVVAAYTVGDSAYAMLSDGRIRVTTPEGQHLFQSMEDLRAFMAARRAGQS